MKVIKNGKVSFTCDQCSKRLKTNATSCLNCGCDNEEAKVYLMETYKKHRKQRMKRLQKSFEEAFDEGCQQIAFKKLKEVKQIVIKELIAALQSDGFFQRIMENANLSFESSQDEWAWMYRRTLSLAKWWHKEQAAFIGCLIQKGVKGHPYLIYLPGQVPSDVVEIKNKADWSVTQTMKYDKSALAEKLNKIKEEMGIYV